MKHSKLILVLTIGTTLLVWSYVVLEPIVDRPEHERAALTNTDSAHAQHTGAPPENHPLQSYLLAEASPERNSVLLSMINDAGFACEEVRSAVQMTPETATWRISCPDAQIYVLQIDVFGNPNIDPLTYGEGLPNQMLRATPVIELPPAPRR